MPANAATVRSFLFELLELDGLESVPLGSGLGTPALHAHRPVYDAVVPIRSGADIDRLLEDAATCRFRSCSGRRRAEAIFEARRADGVAL